MRAIVIRRYGDPHVLQLVNIPKPIPRADEILVKVNATSINPIDWKLRRGQWPLRIIFGLSTPRSRITGMDFAGFVTDVGREVRGFQPGDPVFGVHSGGTLCDYIAVKNDSAVVRKPPNLTVQQAAGMPLAGLTALQALRKGIVKKGSRILIYGASGGVGSFAVQLGHLFECIVTTICSSKNVAWMESLGSDEILDYTKKLALGSDRRFDLVFDTVGKTSYDVWRKYLLPNGAYITATPSIGDLASIILSRGIHSTRAKTLVTNFSRDDLIILGQFARNGRLWTRIDREYQMSDVVEAHRYGEQGHSAGKVIITL